MLKKENENIYLENIVENEDIIKINNDISILHEAFDENEENIYYEDSIQVDFSSGDENEDLDVDVVEDTIIQEEPIVFEFSEEEYHEELSPLDYLEQEDTDYHNEEDHEEMMPQNCLEEEEQEKRLTKEDNYQETELLKHLELENEEIKESSDDAMRTSDDLNTDKYQTKEPHVLFIDKEYKEENKENTESIIQTNVKIEESAEYDDFIPKQAIKQKYESGITDLDTVISFQNSVITGKRQKQVYLPLQKDTNINYSIKYEPINTAYEIESVYDNWEFVKINNINTNNFDWKQYIENYNDLIKDGVTTKDKAWKHWTTYGQKEGRTYSPIRKIKDNPTNMKKTNTEKENFDWKQYIENYDDLIKDGITTKEQAWKHWTNHGKLEGRRYSVLDDSIEFIQNSLPKSNNNFDWKQYIENYEDLINDGIITKEKAWKHWITYGEKEGRTYFSLNTNESNFDWKQYIDNYDDLIKDGITTKEKAWHHWVIHGEKEGRTYFSLNTNECNFDWKQYVENYDDLLNAGINTKEHAWNHWINHGQFEGRTYINIYADELQEYDNLELQTVNHLKFKQKYDRYGVHYFGWNGTVNQFVKHYANLDNIKPYKYNIFFDEWIEKLLVWGNKIINQTYIKEVKEENYKIISFLHNPPFLYWNDPKYQKMISTEMIVNDNTHFNENIFNQISNNNIDKNIILLYVLSNTHKEHIWNTYPDYRKSLVSIHHPINFNIDSDNYFDMNLFLNNKRIINIGWWLRNFKTFIEFNAPSEIAKMILVKNDFSQAFQDIIVKNNNLENITIINEISNDEYVSLFKESCIFADIIDSSANNTILECIKFRTPIILRRTLASEEYLGVNYPLFFNDLEDLEVLSEESFLLDLIHESHIYLTNLNNRKISIETFNNKMLYDLHKLTDVYYTTKLTWVCFVNDISQYYLENLLRNFTNQDNLEQLQLSLFITATDSDYIMDTLAKFTSFSNINYFLLDSKNDFISFARQIALSIDYIKTPYVTYVDCQGSFEQTYSTLFIDYLDSSVNCDIAFSSCRIFYEEEDSYEDILYKEERLLFFKDTDISVITNKGVVWRKEMYEFIYSVCSDDIYLESFWAKCIEHNMNMICISENTLYSIVHA